MVDESDWTITSEHFRDSLVYAVSGHLSRIAQAERERLIKELMGHWVSELEPCLFVQVGTYRILGIGAVGHPGPIIVPQAKRPASPHHYPSAMDFATSDGFTIHLEL